MPVTLTATFVPNSPRTPLAISAAHSLLTAPQFSIVSGATDNFSIFALLLYVITLPGNDADAPGTDAIQEATSPPVHDSANVKRLWAAGFL
jgi:hypothetical protein